MLHHEGSLVEAAEVLDRAPGCIVGPGPTAYVLHLNPTPICPFVCHGDDNDDGNDDDDDDDDNFYIIIIIIVIIVIPMTRERTNWSWIQM